MLSLTANELAFLKSLNNHQVRFIIVGLSSALLQNATVVTQDIDLWIEDLGAENFQKAVTAVQGIYIPAGIAGQNPPMLGPDFLKVFDLVAHMHGLETFADEYKNSLSVSISNVELKILPLERIIASKQAINREKDKAVLPALRAALAVQKQMQR